MPPKLALYQDPDGSKLIAIVTDLQEEARWLKDPPSGPGLRRLESIELIGDLTEWPVNTLYTEDMFI